MVHAFRLPSKLVIEGMEIDPSKYPSDLKAQFTATQAGFYKKLESVGLCGSFERASFDFPLQ